MKLPHEVLYTAAGLVTYFTAAVPFAWIFVRVLKKQDLRQLGSGNIGATNAARVLGKPWFVPIFVLDLLKGFAPVFWLAPWIAKQFPCEH